MEDAQKLIEELPEDNEALHYIKSPGYRGHEDTRSCGRKFSIKGIHKTDRSEEWHLQSTPRCKLYQPYSAGDPDGELQESRKERKTQSS